MTTTRGDVYAIYREMTALDADRILLLRRAEEIHKIIVQKEQTLGQAVAFLDYEIEVGSFVVVTYTPRDAKGRPSGKSETFSGYVVSCRSATPIGPLELTVKVRGFGGREEYRTFFPGGAEYSFDVGRLPE